MKVYITFAASMLIDVSAAALSAPLTKKDVGGMIMMRALQAQDQECEPEATALGLCLESAGVTDSEEIKACAFCPLDAAVNTNFVSCSSSDEDNFYAYVQSCGVEACHATCRDELQTMAECAVKETCLSLSNDAAMGGGFADGLGGFAFISFASVIFAVGIM